MKIYFSGSIAGGRQDQDLYLKIIQHLKKYGQVLTEHIGDSSLTSMGSSKTAKEIHDEDMDWLLQSDLVIAEVTTPSLGVGYEIGRALEHNKPIITIFRPSEGRRLSAMIEGSDTITCHNYQDLSQAIQILDNFFSKVKSN